MIILNINNKEFMSCLHQCVISLTKLTLPEYLHPKRLTLSAFTPAEQVYIQNHKVVKTNKINFYRQSIFLTALPPSLTFKIYQIDDSDRKELMQELRIQPKDLRQINLRPSSFRTISQGFQLDWESWIFTEESEEFNQYTERDYSQLDLPFYMQELTTQSRLFLDSSILKEQPTIELKNKTTDCSSTDSSSSPEPKQPAGNGPKDSNLRGNLVEKKGKSPNKQRTKIKSHLYTQLVKMASGLFSQSSLQ